MTPEQQAEVVQSLPGEVTYDEMAMPEGELHLAAKIGAMQQLKGYFQRQGRGVYVVAELPVYYPDADRFAPDVLAVLDVETHERDFWFVRARGWTGCWRCTWGAIGRRMPCTTCGVTPSWKF